MRARPTTGQPDTMPATLSPGSGQKCGVQSLYRTAPDARGRTSWSAESPSDAIEAAETEETAKYALLVRYEKGYDGRRKFVVHSIVVQNPFLKLVLGELLKDYTGVATSVRRLEFHAPWQPFVHRWDKLVAIKDKYVARASEPEADATATQERDFVILLYDFLRGELQDTIDTVVDLTQQSLITYEFLWTLFEPGTIITYGDQAFKVGTSQETDRGYQVNCSYIDWNGTSFGYASHCFLLCPFAGTRSIRHLMVYPLAFRSDQQGLRRKILERTRKLQSLCGFRYKQYHGVAEIPIDRGYTRLTVHGRVILDTESWNDFNADLAVKVSALEVRKNPNMTNGPRDPALDFLTSGADQHHGFDEDLEYQAESEPSHMPTSIKSGATQAHNEPVVPLLTEQQMLITTSIIRGYSCKDKKWMRFSVDNISDIVWNGNAFDSLVLPDDQKALVRAVAESQARNSHCFDDVIQGKGQGMILLLSGPPGVGKTLTAESVAEVMRVPLYYMSSVDLGSDAANVETTLSKVFTMVTKWGAVLLLDEADVFLEKRTNHDLDRNRLVSVFLRILEYYEGTLFLTTNRGTSIDDAFQSRIHIRLNYHPLAPESRYVVWKNFLNSVKYRHGHDIDEGGLRTLADKNLNGRQIKNLLKTSVLLAASKDEVLGNKHVEFVLGIDRHA